MLLIVESSADFPSACLVNVQGDIVFSVQSNKERSHAETLPVLIEQCMAFLKKDQIVLDAAAINEGPGSYTGLRIGTSLIKGLCYGLNIPLIAINGLEAMALWATLQFPEKKNCYALIDARRDEVYAWIRNFKGEIIPTEAVIITPETWEIHPEEDLLIGNANGKTKRILGIEGVQSIEGPFASQLVPLALEYWKAERFVSVAYFEPNYLKEFQAGISKKFSV